MPEYGQEMATLASELVAKGEQKNRPLFLPATVSSYDSGERTAFVTVDGDQGLVATSVVSLIGVVATGERVMVQFEPPQGAFIVGSLSGRGGTVLARMSHTSSHTGIATGAQIDGAYSLTITVPAGRLIEITVLHPASAGEDVDSGWSVYLKEDGADLIEIATAKTITRWADLGRYPFNGTVWHAPSAGTHTYTLNAIRFAGTGTFASGGGGRTINQMMIKDIGAA